MVCGIPLYMYLLTYHFIFIFCSPLAPVFNSKMNTNRIVYCFDILQKINIFSPAKVLPTNGTNLRQIIISSRIVFFFFYKMQRDLCFFSKVILSFFLTTAFVRFRLIFSRRVFFSYCSTIIYNEWCDNCFHLQRIIFYSFFSPFSFLLAAFFR